MRFSSTVFLRSGWGGGGGAAAASYICGDSIPPLGPMGGPAAPVALVSTSKHKVDTSSLHGTRVARVCAATAGR